MTTLAVVEKIAILRALVDSNYSTWEAARKLGITRRTVNSKLWRWNLTPPMFTSDPKREVLRSEYVARCWAIKEALEELERK